jgi:type II secretory pathway pseudopilin PulG
VVAIGLFSVLATIIVLTFSSFTTTLTRDRAATTNTNLATLGMDEMTRMIRSATSIPQISGVDLPAFVYANKEKVVFYAYIDTESTSPEPVKVQFEVATAASGNIQIRDLVETRWAAHPKAGAPNYWEFDAANDPQSVRVVARKIVNRAAGEAYLFNYQEIGADLLPDDMTIPVSGIAAANLPKIAVVEVTIKVQSDATGRAAPVTMTNQVGIPNLGISRLGLS